MQFEPSSQTSKQLQTFVGALTSTLEYKKILTQTSKQLKLHKTRGLEPLPLLCSNPSFWWERISASSTMEMKGRT